MDTQTLNNIVEIIKIICVMTITLLIALTFFAALNKYKD